MKKYLTLFTIIIAVIGGPYYNLILADPPKVKEERKEGK